MRAVIGCEEPQAVCKAFRAKGHEAYSCDLIPCSGGHPEWHIVRDVLEVIKGGFFKTEAGTLVYIEKWDLGIYHPPCDHLAVSGARWFPEKQDGRQQAAIEFFMALANAPIERIAIENPVCIMSTVWRKPDQIINPFQFGHPEQKKTCLWLKNLPLLNETNNVYDYMMTLPLKERTRIHYLGSRKSKERSVTFTGIAGAMASQWSV